MTATAGTGPYTAPLFNAHTGSCLFDSLERPFTLGSILQSDSDEDFFQRNLPKRKKTAVDVITSLVQTVLKLFR